MCRCNFHGYCCGRVKSGRKRQSRVPAAGKQCTVAQSLPALAKPRQLSQRLRRSSPRIQWKERGSLLARCGCGSPGVSAAQNLQSLQRHFNERLMALRRRTAEARRLQSSPTRKFSASWQSYALPMPHPGRMSERSGCAARYVGVPEWLAMRHSTREEFNTNSGEQQESHRTGNHRE